MNTAVFTPGFQAGCSDYLYLLNRGYPGRGSLNLVGNHYRLTRFQRVILYRGIFSSTESARRSKMLIPCYKEEKLTLDFLNVLFTIANYLYGRIVFLATDGLLKDNGECFTKPGPGAILLKALGLLFEFLALLRPPLIRCCLDLDYDYCRYIITEAEKQPAALPLNCEMQAVKNPDKVLESVTEGLIATADSTVIDRAECHVFDIAHQVIRKNFRHNIVDLAQFMGR